MYSSYVSTLSKVKLLLTFLKNGFNAKNLLTGLTYLSVIIVVMTLAKPVFNFVKRMFLKMFGRKNDKSSSDRKYAKLDSISESCSACKSSSVSLSDDSSSFKNKKNKKDKKDKKCKVKLSKNKINKTLKNFKLE